MKHARNIGVCGVDIVEKIAPIPKVRVQRYDTETILILDRVSPIVKPCLICGGRVNPSILLPERRYTIGFNAVS